MAKYKIIPSSRTIVHSPISIGRKAEKGVEAIEFDLTAWVETYGSGTLTVIMRRWGDAIPYPIALEIDENNKATWTLSDIDTAKAGMAYAQLNYIVGETVVKKSDIYTFRVMDSLTGEGEPPEAYESWLEHLTHLAAEAMAEVLDIEGVVTDKTLTVDGGIADAKKTGDELNTLKADLLANAKLQYPLIEQGYYSTKDGTKGDSTAWCRTANFINPLLKFSGKNVGMVLLAYNANGEYVGAWDGNAFVNTKYDKPMRILAHNIKMFASLYPQYLFKIDFRRIDDDDLSTQDVQDDVQIDTVFIDEFNLSINVKKINTLYYCPVKTGTHLEVISNSDAYSQWKLNLYDANGVYLNFYGLPSGHKRIISSTSIDFDYVSIDAPLDDIDVTIVNGENLFNANAFNDLSRYIGINRADITNLAEAVDNISEIYRKEKAASEAIIRGYGGSKEPPYCDAYFMWISDIHAEVQKTIEFANVVTNFGNSIVPFVLNTGDTVKNIIGDGIAWYNDIIQSMSVPVLNTVGNHDAYVTNGVITENKTIVYNEIIKPFVSNWGVNQPENAETNGYCYYYKDIQSVRLIVLDSMYWDATQKTWFEELLTQSIIDNKHVVVACHAPFASNLCTMVESIWNTGFLSRDRTVTPADALSCVQEFKASGGKFVAWLQGHVHGDEVVTLDDGKQLAVCTNSFSNRGTKVYKTNNTMNYNYNSYTMIAIDANLNLFKMYRIGADISVTGKRHNGFVWNYSTNNLVDEW